MAGRHLYANGELSKLTRRQIQMANYIAQTLGLVGRLATRRRDGVFRGYVQSTEGRRLTTGVRDCNGPERARQSVTYSSCA